MVTADPSFYKTRTGNRYYCFYIRAANLRGGTLMTPLKGADGETYAIAQGNLVGGLGVEGGDGSSIIEIFQL